MSLLTRLLILVCLALAPALAIQGYQEWQLRSVDERATDENALRILALVEGELDRRIEGVRQSLSVLSETMAVQRHDEAACHALLQRVSANAPTDETLYAADREGHVWCSNDSRLIGDDVSSRFHVRQALATGHFIIGNFIYRRSNRHPALPLAHPYQGLDGRPGGVIVTLLESGALRRALTLQALPRHGQLTLADRNGLILVCEPPLGQPGQAMEAHRLAVLTAPERGTLTVEDGDRIERVVAYAPVTGEERPLFLAVGLPRSSLLGGAHTTARTALGVLLTDLLLAVGLVLFAYRRLVRRPLDELGAATRHWQQGNYTVRPPLPSCRELRDLCLACADMAATVAGREGAQKCLEAELVAAKRQAEEANRYKTSFLATASHDLRQPVQSLMLFLACLAGQAHDPKEQVIISRIGGAIASLKALLDGLLDISRLESGSVLPQKTDMPLEPLLTRLTAEYEPQAQARRLTFTVVRSSLWVHTDGMLLERILRNLIENALKYTRRGRVLVGCRREGDLVRLQVLDSGIGIPPEAQQRIFEEYQQLDNPEHDAAKGLGLGLAIVRRLSRLLGYRLDLRSRVGRGTAFSIWVPRAAPTLEDGEGKDGAEARDILPGCVALIEDEDLVRESLEHQMTDWGIDVFAAAEDQELATRLNGKQPDLIIADYRLRDGATGLQAIHRLESAIGESVPAILLTGETDPATLDSIRATGLGILHKPLQPEELRHAIARLVPPHGKPSKPPSRISPNLHITD